MLTVLGIEKLKPKEKSYKVSDGNALYLLVEPTGGKLWRIRYKFSAKKKMLSLGAFPEVSLADARAKRDEAQKLLRRASIPRIRSGRTSSWRKSRVVIPSAPSLKSTCKSSKQQRL
jgi:Arm DNA-binding domain